MKSRKAYVIGAGLAGLSASVRLAAAGMSVELFESAGQAGGRCRSYFDATLGMTIDNGNHLLLSGNHATMAYLRTIGSAECLTGPEHAHLAFADVQTGKCWTIKPDDGLVPFWLFEATKRVPDTKPFDYLQLISLLSAGRDRTIGDVLSCDGALWERLLRPFFLAALNTEPRVASATLAAALVRETFAKGGRAYRPRIAQPTLAAAFVDPAIRHLWRAGTQVHLGERLKKIRTAGSLVTGLDIADSTATLGPGDIVVLATPPWVAQELVPDISAPNVFSSIVNAHFKFGAPADAPRILGMLGGTAEWIFAFPDRISVTVSGADRLVDLARDVLAEMLWRDVAKALGLPAALPPWQIVKEKRATFAATPDQARLRPKTNTAWENLYLAGDWTDTGLPATIEGAVRSGHKAAQMALAREIR